MNVIRPLSTMKQTVLLSKRTELTISDDQAKTKRRLWPFKRRPSEADTDSSHPVIETQASPDAQVAPAKEPVITAAKLPNEPKEPKDVMAYHPNKRLALVRVVLRRGLQPFSWTIRHLRAIRATSWTVALYALGLFATQVTLIWFSQAGLVLNMLMLFVLTSGALIRQDLRKLSISLAILPVTQMVSSSFLTHNNFQTAAIFYAVLLLLALIYRYLFTLDEPVQKSQLHWKGHFFGLPLMIIIGEGLGLAGYAFLHHHYRYIHTSLPLVFAGIIVFAFAEEMFLRGLIHQQAARVVHPLLAASITALLYVPLALSHTTLLTLGPAIAMGVMLAGVYYVKHNVLLSVAINAAAKLTYVGLVATFILR